MILACTAMQGDEVTVTRTAESFSLFDITEWLRLLNAVILYDLTEKQTTLHSVSCSPARMEHVCKVWKKKYSDKPTLSGKSLYHCPQVYNNFHRSIAEYLLYSGTH